MVQVKERLQKAYFQSEKQCFKLKNLKIIYYIFFVHADSFLVRRFFLFLHWIAISIIPALTFLSSFSLEFLHLKWYFHASFSSFTLGSILRLDCGRLLNITAWSKLRNATCLGGCLSAILFPLVPREAREFNTCVFCVLSSRGPFQPMKRCENWLFPCGRFQVKTTNCKVCVLQEDTSFYFNLQSFSCQVQQKVLLMLVSDVFSI